MIILIFSLFWISCIAFSFWRAAEDFGQVTLSILLLAVVFGPIVSGVALLSWVLESGDPVIYRRSRK